ncbi:DUF4395 family protein [Sulfurovum sp. XTW-4]|uniref:DUF4395 family protein n=1 Tax=Sulfurovum xiamenensis TaxID=3019066 RepID=A0ABT7QSH2_9BACT|nr:DUF4395 family protein [Sulfurovum xiamenensis]MDM5263960.1 DUF4395 family protein [Sulfurovum xiamenensis]
MNNIVESKYTLIDENQLRIVATLVALTMVAYVFLGYKSLLILLIYHFFISIYLSPSLSPLEFIANRISLLFSYNLNNKETSEKEFALHLALFITCGLIVLELFGYIKLESTLILLLVIWKIVEASTKICFGCKLYQYIKKNGIEIISL